MVALLGPSGSGKSTALQALSRECGGTVVHARLDFAEHPDLDPIAAAAFVAFSLMRGWTNLRRRPVFHRLGLSLLALNEQLDSSRDVAQAQIKGLIQQYLQRQPLVRFGERVPDVLFTAAEVANAVGGIAVPNTDIVRDRAKPVIGALLRSAARVGLRGAMSYHRRVPETEDASTVDWLIALSTGPRTNAVDYVMRALLADIEAFVRDHPPASAPCDCLVPEDARDRSHDHVWLLLLDNVRSTAGEQFVQALIKARQRRFDVPPGTTPECDPLLVVTAVDRWRPAWGQWWREPWQTKSLGRRPIRVFSEADRGQWARHARDAPRTNTAAGWYPVWLDPVSGDGVAGPRAGLPWNRADVAALASGHPAAMNELESALDEVALRADGDPLPATILDVRDDEGSPLWERAARAALPGLLPADRTWQEIPAAVVVAARLSEPARRGDDLPVERFPDATRTQRELRTHLWISTFAARPSPLWRVSRGDEEHPAALHPWLSRCLLAGLAADSTGAGPSTWDRLFAEPFDTDPDPGRTLFRHLAQGRFTAVVKELVDMFDAIDHLAWVRLLDDATSAPCRLPHREPFAVSHHRLVPDHVPGRTAVEAAVTSLTALLWLCRDPLAMPVVPHNGSKQAPWHEKIQTDFGKLANLSARADVSALEQAAGQFESLF
jgi:hypothetical protein